MPRKKLWLIVVISGVLLGSTLLTFWPLTQAAFIQYDDPEYVTANAQVQSGINFHSVRWALTSFHAGNWHPVTWISHMIDCDFFGMEPAAHHVTNLLLHLANTWLLFAVLKRMTGALWGSAFVAALFALHPLHVESVAWISERKDVLSGTFFMLTLWSYTSYAERRAQMVETSRATAAFGSYWLHYAFSLLFFALGLMSKPMLVTLPCVLLLLDFWPLQRFKSSSSQPATFNFPPATLARLLFEKLPFFVLSAASCAITLWVQRSAGAVASLGQLSLQGRIANAVVAYCRYVGKMFWSTDLSVIYYFPRHKPFWLVAGAILVLCSVTLLTVWVHKRRPYLLFGWLWFLITLLPVIGLIQVGVQSMADRYTYLPLIGLFISLTWATKELLGSWRYRFAVLAISASLSLAACAVLTYRQVQLWQTNEKLFTHALELAPDNPVAHDNLGCGLMLAGRLDEAMTHFAEAVRLRPVFFNARHHLAYASFLQGKNEEAIRQYQIVLKEAPAFARGHYNLGCILEAEGRLGEARACFEQTLRLEPTFSEARARLKNLSRNTNGHE